MKKHFLFCSMLIISIIAISCKDTDNVTDSDDVASSASYEDSTDYVIDATSAINITLNESSISASGSGVTVSGTTATITAGGTYQISGTLTNGQILVNSEDTKAVKLILNGVTISNTKTSPLYIKKSEKTIIDLADGTKNTISDASAYVYAANEDEPSAAIFSNSNLTIFGTGALTVKGNYADGISSDDGLIIKSGTISVTAADDAIRGKDFLIVYDGAITATATTGHALKSDNENDATCGYVAVKGGTLTLTSTAKDGINAAKYITIDGGLLNIAAASGQGMNGASAVEINNGTLNITKSKEGIESNFITINNGTINIAATDDGLNSTMGSGSEQNDGSCLTINGGYIAISASGGDGLDSNGNMVMTGGTVVIHGPQSQPEVSLDYNGTFNISGGLLIASGTNSNMTQAPGTGSSQYSLKLVMKSAIAASTLVNIQDSNGAELVTFQPVRSYYSVIFSSPKLVSGGTYSVYTGGTSTGTVSNGLYSGGTYSGGTLKTTFTVSSKVTSLSVN